ncbi:hypothetical protein ACUODJ_48560, partial [Escherichia sp. HC-CC]
TRDGAYNLDYINDTVAEFGKKVQDGSKGTADAFAAFGRTSAAKSASCFPNGSSAACVSRNAL